jgi:hypothetical protein
LQLRVCPNRQTLEIAVNWYQVVKQQKGNTMETLIYGLEKNETQRYMETLLSTNTKTQDDIDRVIKVATEHGFHSFRIATYNGEAPNFINTINKGI